MVARSNVPCSATINPISSVPGEILPRHEFYSYEAKYLDENGRRAGNTGEAAVGDFRNVSASWLSKRFPCSVVKEWRGSISS